MYLSVSELGIPEDVLIRLTDDEGAGSINTGRAEAAISAAQALVDSALSRIYDVPFSSPPDLVKGLTRDLALYNLYMRVGSLPQEVLTAYEHASGILEKVAGGLFFIGLDAPGPEFSYQDREFSREYMEGF
jgi:phage gp36-like protein